MPGDCPKKGAYARAGVDTGAEAEAVKSLVDAAEQEQLPGVFAKYLYNRGIALGISTDGVGSKLLCYLWLGDVSGSAFDLLAMNATDLAAEYIRPLLFTDYAAVHTMDPELFRQMGKGLGEACRVSEVYLAGGESATLSNQIKEGTFDWAGAVTGFEDAKEHQEWIRRREEGLFPEMQLIGVKSSGIHSNALSLARKLKGLVPLDHRIPGGSKTVLQELTTPTFVYAPTMCRVRDGAYFFAPITGGGFRNVQRVLPVNMDAKIEIPDPPPLFRFMEDRLEGVDTREMLEVTNYGWGLVMGAAEPGGVIDTFKEAGYKADVIGYLKHGVGKVHVNGMTLRNYDE